MNQWKQSDKNYNQLATGSGATFSKPVGAKKEKKRTDGRLITRYEKKIIIRSQQSRDTSIQEVGLIACK